MNTRGNVFRITVFGESHGRAVGVVVDGCPAGIEIAESQIQGELDRRKPGTSAVSTPRKEEDRVEILSGVFEGKSTGAPIALVVYNKDADSSKYEKIKDMFRPGHAEFGLWSKHGFHDHRGGAHSSGRITLAYVAAGAIAKKILETSGIEIVAHSKEIAGIGSGVDLERSLSIEKPDKLRKKIYSNPVRAIAKEAEMESAILEAKKDGDSVGGIIEAVVTGVPAGLGAPLFNKLSADISSAVFSIPAVKAIEFGKGFALARMKGSESNDPFALRNGKIITKTNNCGGILGGISTGMPIVFRLAVKPTSSIAKKQRTVNYRKMEEADILVEGRHDPCIVPRAVPVVEAMAAIVLADHLLLDRISK